MQVHALPSYVTEATEIKYLGGELTPASLVAGLSRGVFPMNIEDLADFLPASGSTLGWFSPNPRAVLTRGQMHVSRSLRRSMRTFTFSLDTAFLQVLAGCANPARPHGWMTTQYQTVYYELFQRQLAHSIEVWSHGELAGGLLAVELGGLICAETMFHTVTDASKAAVFLLASLTVDSQAQHLTSQTGQPHQNHDPQHTVASGIESSPGPSFRLIDAQWPTDHLHSLGFTEITRSRYLAYLPKALSEAPLLRSQRGRGWRFEQEALVVDA